MVRETLANAFFAYANNYLIDTDHAVIVDVEASRAIRQAEVGATRTMIERTRARFGLYPEVLTADQAYSGRDARLARGRRGHPAAYPGLR